MERITTEEKYNEKVEAFKLVYNDESVSMEEKIRLCEEFAYSEYVKGSDRIDYAGDLAEYYLKTGQYRKAICFILEEFKTHFKDDDKWWMFIAGLCPFFCFYVIDAHIALKEYHMAKGVLDALKKNREKMLKMHPDDGFTRDCEFWYACVITKYVQIALLEGDASAALDYLVNEPIFERYKNLESFFIYGNSFVREFGS